MQLEAKCAVTSIHSTAPTCPICPPSQFANMIVRLGDQPTVRKTLIEDNHIPLCKCSILLNIASDFYVGIIKLALIIAEF